MLTKGNVKYINCNVISLYINSNHNFRKSCKSNNEWMQGENVC